MQSEDYLKRGHGTHGIIALNRTRTDFAARPSDHQRVLAVMLVIYRFCRDILAAFVRFDQRNVARIQEQEREKTDPIAHFRHALEVADEQVEEISEITVQDPMARRHPCRRFVFEGEQFATRFDAERVRAEKNSAPCARGFYRERAAQALATSATRRRQAATRPLRPSSGAAACRCRRRHGA